MLTNDTTSSTASFSVLRLTGGYTDGVGNSQVEDFKKDLKFSEEQQAMECDTSLDLICQSTTTTDLLLVYIYYYIYYL